MTLALVITAATVLVLLFVFPYVLYPVLVRRWSVRGPATGRTHFSKEAFEARAPSTLPVVSVLIPAHNEARHLRNKLNNTLQLNYPADRLDIVVCSDGSSDGTDDIAREFANRGVRLTRNERRSGKSVALQRLVNEARGELVLFSDASAHIDSWALARLVTVLEDDTIGVAAARYIVAGAEENGEAESGYWSSEARLRAAESERDMLLGASGAGFVIRRELMPGLHPDTVNDDYVIALAARAKGYRVAYVHDATASDAPTESSTTLYRRWVRIAFGNYQMLWRNRRLFATESRLAVPLLRKLARTMGPWFLLLLCTLVTWNRDLHPILAFSTVVGWSLIGVATLSVLTESMPWGQARPFRLLRFMALAQSAYFQGSVRYILRQRSGIWRRAPENEVSTEGPAPLPLSVRVLKRSIDILGALTLLIVFSPVMLLLAILIPLESRGSAIYVQERERPGPSGAVPFRMFKFRSMVQDAEATTGPVWAQGHRDARVTRIGGFIRKFRLDELPQLFNVLRGDMSIVGPRPERPFFTRSLAHEIPGYADRIHVIKPGITGWAQVNQPPDQSKESVEEKVMLDLAYLAQLYNPWSYLRIEFIILFRTVWVMVSGTKSG